MAEVIDPLLVLCWGIMHDFTSDFHSDLLVSCMVIVYNCGGGGRIYGYDYHGFCIQIWRC